MAKLIDRVSETIASGIPRREAIKRVAGMLAGAAAVVATGSKLEASQVAQAPSKSTKTLRKLTVQVTSPDGTKSLLHLPDKFHGGASYKDQAVTILPTVSADGDRVNLAIYSGKTMDKPPLHNLDLALGKSLEVGRAASHALNLAPMPIAGFAAYWAGSARVAEDYTPDADCTVTCCGGLLTLTACGACCDRLDPGCGNCCDGGCCPGCIDLPPGE